MSKDYFWANVVDWQEFNKIALEQYGRSLDMRCSLRGRQRVSSFYKKIAEIWVSIEQKTYKTAKRKFQNEDIYLFSR